MFCNQCGEAIEASERCKSCGVCSLCCECEGDFESADFDDDELGEDPEYDWETGPGRR